MNRRIFALAGLAGLVGLVGACRQPPPVDSATTTAAEVATTAPALAIAPAQRQAGECDTLFDVETPDTLRVVRGASVVLYANEQVGLAIVDVSDPDHPKMKG